MAGGQGAPAVSPAPRPYSPEGAVATALFVAVIATMLLQIVARLGLFVPPIWTEELSRWLWVWMACFGMAEVERRNEHLAVDFLLARLPAAPKRAVQAGTDLVYLFVIGTLIWIGVGGVIRELPNQAVTMPTSDAVLYASYPAAAAFIAMRILRRLIGHFRGTEPAERAPC